MSPSCLWRSKAGADEPSVGLGPGLRGGKGRGTDLPSLSVDWRVRLPAYPRAACPRTGQPAQVPSVAGMAPPMLGVQLGEV